MLAARAKFICLEDLKDAPRQLFHLKIYLVLKLKLRWRHTWSVVASGDLLSKI